MHSPLLNDDFYSKKSSGTLFLPCSVTESIILLGTFPTHLATLITAFDKDEYYVPDEDDPIPQYQLFPFARNDGPPPTTFYPVLLSRPYSVVTQPPSHAEGRQLYLAISYVQETMIRYFCPYTELPIIKLDDDKARTLFRQRLARIKSSLVSFSYYYTFMGRSTLHKVSCIHLLIIPFSYRFITESAGTALPIVPSSPPFSSAPSRAKYIGSRTRVGFPDTSFRC